MNGKQLGKRVREEGEGGWYGDFNNLIRITGYKMHIKF
jgi:hypothetical protein